MKTVRRLLYRDIVSSVLFVAVAFLSLFFFIDFVEELGEVGRRGRTTMQAVSQAALELPGHFYELFPIAVLIGTIYALARMAQSSEFTILRTGGLGPGRALSLLAMLGIAFALVTFVIGDYVAPPAGRAAVELRGGFRAGAAGAWLKEKRETPEGEMNVSIHIASTEHGVLQGVRIFEFDTEGRLVTRTQAREATVADDGTWKLVDADVTHWPRAADGRDAGIHEERLPSLAWTSRLAPSVVAAAVLPLQTMTTVELWRYKTHLSDQAQATRLHEVRFWHNALYPFACLVMVALALPFAYLHARAGGVSLKVFGGIMLGISFVLLNNLAGHIGMLSNAQPWLVAAAPGVLYLLMSLAAFAWLVRFR
jgi:lipopolysaccharide export system permease protein